MKIILIGMETSKHIFQLHRVDDEERPIFPPEASASGGDYVLREAGTDRGGDRGVPGSELEKLG